MCTYKYISAEGSAVFNFSIPIPWTLCSVCFSPKRSKPLTPLLRAACGVGRNRNRNRNPKKMKIRVKTLKGTHFVIQANPQDTVADVKKNIEEAAKGARIYPAALQMLIHQGKVLKDATTLEENKVVEDNFVVIMLSKNKVSSRGASTDSSLPSNVEAQPQISFPPTSSTSEPPASTVEKGQSYSEQSPVITPPTAAVSSINAHATSNLNTGSNLESTIQQVLDMGGGNWDRDTVIRALRAAFNNPERAIEYLYCGIPEQADVAEVSRSPMTRQAENSPQAPQPAIHSGPNTNPLNLFPQGIPETDTITNDDARYVDESDFLRNNPQFQELRAVVRADPGILQSMLEDLAKSNPRLLQVIRHHQDELLDLINEPIEDENLRSQLASMIPEAPTFTPEESEAIQRLQDMGFDRDLVLEVFFACNKNEDIAANYLLDHQNEFED